MDKWIVGVMGEAWKRTSAQVTGCLAIGPVLGFGKVVLTFTESR